MSFLHTLYQLMFSGSLMAIFVILFRSFIRKKLPSISLFIFWTMVACFYLVPMNFSSPIDLFEGDEMLEVVRVVETVMVPDSIRLSPSDYQEQAQPLKGSDVLVFTWLVGVGIVALYLLFHKIRLHRWLRDRKKLESTPYADLLLPFRRHIRIYQSDRVGVAMTYGVFCPKIFISSALLSEDEKSLRYVLLHELQHIRTFDSFVASLWLGFVCVFWFNPIVWVSRFLLMKDIEFLCDTQVVKRLGHVGIADYARTILNFTPVRNRFRSTLSFPLSSTSKRIGDIIACRTPSRRAWWILFISISLALSIVIPCSATVSNSNTVYTDYAGYAGNYLLIRVDEVDFPLSKPEDNPARQYTFLGSFSNLDSASSSIGFSGENPLEVFSYAKYNEDLSDIVTWTWLGVSAWMGDVKYLLFQKDSFRTNAAYQSLEESLHWTLTQYWDKNSP